MSYDLIIEKPVSIVPPADEDAPVKRKADVSRIVQSLLGAIPYTDMTLSELREERLRKYDIAD